MRVVYAQVCVCGWMDLVAGGGGEFECPVLSPSTLSSPLSPTLNLEPGWWQQVPATLLCPPPSILGCRPQRTSYIGSGVRPHPFMLVQEAFLPTEPSPYPLSHLPSPLFILHSGHLPCPVSKQSLSRQNVSSSPFIYSSSRHSSHHGQGSVQQQESVDAALVNLVT